MAVTTYPDLPGLGFPIKHAPQFTTARYEALSGKRTTAPKQTYPRWTWELPYNFLRSAYYGSTTGAGAYAELETLVAFFNARSADGMVFAYEDQEDNTAVDQPFGSGDGATTTFQLYRAYGGFTEPVYSAVPTEVKVAGVALDPADYAVGETGIVTFDVAPAGAAALVWSGAFSFLCRFNDDTLDLQRVMQGLSEGSLKFSSELGL